MIEALRKYNSAGIACLPTNGKIPALGKDESWSNGITDESKYANCDGIGLICGSISGGLECMDWDNHFGDAKENLSAFIQQIKAIYDKYKFPIESTVSGGFHLVYRCKKIGGNSKLASRPKWSEKFQMFRPDAIIETRGEGGYFVAAPTTGYVVVKNSFLQIPEITETERDEMISVAKTFNTWHELKPTEHEQKDRPGDIFNQSTTAGEEAKEALLSGGWKEKREGMWCRPEKDEGTSATFGKVAENIFYCFTSNGFPFEPNKAYTPFQVITLLKYKGDFKEHARVLADRFNLNRPQKKEFAKREDKKYELKQIDEFLKTNLIDFNIPIQKPPIALKIRDFEHGNLYDKRLFTLGNFSAITGKSKSKKTFLTSLFLAAAAKGGGIDNKIMGTLPEGKSAVLCFDTEQSQYDAYVSGRRVIDLIGREYENYGCYHLREFTPVERCQIIEGALEKFKEYIGYVVIDGIADLANANNDEEEATRVVSLLMKWSKIYNCHITVVIHQNKNDNYATGHLGSSILKKAECIISVEKNPDNKRSSFVKCDMIRGTSDFADFEITINDKYLPEITEMKNIASHYKVVETDF